MKILIIRTDRIGDVVLSLPLGEILKERFPESEIYYMLKESTSELVKHQPYIDKTISFNNNGLRRNIKMLSKEQFDVAILLYPTFSLSLILFLSHIPERIGTGFRWYSFLLNKRTYEHRHTSEKHELQYNLRLLKKMGITTGIKIPKLFLTEKEKSSALSFLSDNGIDSKRFIVVHPGSGGSTLSWPEENFKILVKLMQKEFNYHIVLTGTKNEYEKNNRIREGCDTEIVNIAGKTNLRELMAIISLAQLFISNSTGPMHIATAVDTNVIAFFPPSRANRKKRWGPLSHALVFEPPVPYCKRCIRDKCQYYNCLSLISPEDVMEKFLNWEIE